MLARTWSTGNSLSLTNNGMEVGTTTLENHLAVQPKPSIRLSYDPTERGTSIRQKVRTRTFIATLLIIPPQ